MAWGAFISAGIGVWVKKALFSLGIGVITFVGFSALEAQIRAYVANAWSGLPSAAYQILALAGFVDMLGIAVASISAAVALLSLKRIGVLNS
jgi:hypothetical protein